MKINCCTFVSLNMVNFDPEIFVGDQGWFESWKNMENCAEKINKGELFGIFEFLKLPICTVPVWKLQLKYSPEKRLVPGCVGRLQAVMITQLHHGIYQDVQMTWVRPRVGSRWM